MEELLARYAKIPERIRYPVGVAILLTLVAGFYFTVSAGQDSTHEELQQELSRLETNRAEKRAYAENLVKYEARFSELQQALNTARAMLPDNPDVPQFLAQLGNNAREAGLEIQRFEPTQEQERDFYSEINFTMEVRGSYHEIGSFIDSVGKLDRIVNVTDISMVQPATENQRVVVKGSFTVKTYRFISEVEKQALEEKRKKAKDKKK